MAISENQLDIWAKQGSITQSANTYKTIRSALDDVSAPYHSKDYNIFLQGSYGNDTNIYADSDVDVVIKLGSTYYSDLSNLDENELALYNSKRTDATYSYDEFKADVIRQLTARFGSNVKPGSKAIFVQGENSRRDADVIAAAEFRKYIRFHSFSNQNYIEGICFWTKDGIKIINYPKLHSSNCTSKHQATISWFKPVVRIFKNMRNSMIANGYIEEGLAPSYFLEGLLYNVPNDKFGVSYEQSLVAAINWISRADHTKLLCANEQYYLLHPTSPVTWRKESLERFLAAVIKFWKAY